MLWACSTDIKTGAHNLMCGIMRSMRSRLSRVFAGSKFDALVLMNTEEKDANFTYLTGFYGGVFEQDVLMAFPDRMVLLTSELEAGIADEQRPKEMEIVVVDKREKFQKELGAHLAGKKVGISGGYLPYAYYKFIRKYAKAKGFGDAQALFARAREIKEPEEIDTMRSAVRITKKALGAIPAYFKEGMTELQLAARFNYLMMEQGAQKTSFDSIVSFGANSALPHHMPDSTKLRPNSIVLLDVGAMYKNYCADMTRTFVFKADRRSSKYARIMEMHKVVEQAQRLGLESIRPGADGHDVHMKVAEFIDTAEHGRYRGKFIHSLGHDIGLEVHDSGLGLGMHKNILKQGMVLSDEPGIYVQGFGGVRIEDDVLVTKDGARFL